MRVIEYERAKNVAHKQKTLIKSSEDGKWSITRAFLKCRNEVPWSHEQLISLLKEELQRYRSYYNSMCDDDMTEQFQKYEEEGICSDAYSDVIIQGLSIKTIKTILVQIFAYNAIHFC